jgi:CheY-like chemotaxis protein
MQTGCSISNPRTGRADAVPEPRRALLAIAEPASERLCRETLRTAGFAVESVDSGIGAVTAVRERPPQLVIVDMQLRDVPGREAIGWLRSNPALGSAPVILLVGAEEDGAGLSPRPGVCLRKPLSRLAIERACLELLNRELR